MSALFAESDSSGACGLLADLARRPKPALADWGDEDLVLPVRRLVAPGRIAHEWTHLFAGVGRMPQIELAEKFVDLVGEHFGGGVADTCRVAWGAGRIGRIRPVVAVCIHSGPVRDHDLPREGAG